VYPAPVYPAPVYPAPVYPAHAYPAHLGPPPVAPEHDELPPRTPSEGAVWVAIAFAGFLVGQVLSAVALYVGAAITGNLGDVAQLAARTVPPGWVVICGLVGLWVGFVGAVVVASHARGTGSIRRDMGLEMRPWDLLIGPAVGLGGQLVLLPLLYLPLEHFVPNLSKRLSQPAKHLTGGFPGADLALIAVLTVVVVPVVEETLFRGLVLRGFLRLFARAGPALGPAIACCSTGIVFGLAHFELLELLGLAAFGVVLSVMAFKFRRLGPGIFAHATFNLVAIVVLTYPTGILR